MPRSRHASARTVLAPLVAPLVALLAGGCASGAARPSAPPAPARDGCELAPAPGVAPDSLQIPLAEPVDRAHAPRPRTAGERLVFAQLYETLVRVDCTGQVLPGLARSWSVDTSGRQWTFTLRDDARFWSGAPVTATDVIASWRAATTTAALASAAVAVDARTLVVTLPNAESMHDAPRLFAAAELAVAQAGSIGSAAAWPAGSGSYRVAPEAPGASPTAPIVLAPRDGGSPRLILHPAAGSDARDLLDGGADLVLVDDPAVVQYAETQPQRVAIALPWSRTYALLLRARNAEADDAAPGVLAARRALADAVHADARGAEPPFWWREREAGAASAPEVPPPPHAPHGGADGPARIVYERGDRVARDLAERLVALAAPEGAATEAGTFHPAATLLGAQRRVWRTLGVDSAEFARALHAGGEAAYVISLPHQVLRPGEAARALVTAAPWLGAPAALDSALVPLVDVRLVAIVRRGALGLAADWDGAPRLLLRDSPLGMRQP